MCVCMCAWAVQIVLSMLVNGREEGNKTREKRTEGGGSDVWSWFGKRPGARAVHQRRTRQHASNVKMTRAARTCGVWIHQSLDDYIPTSQSNASVFIAGTHPSITSLSFPEMYLAPQSQSYASVECRSSTSEKCQHRIELQMHTSTEMQSVRGRECERGAEGEGAAISGTGCNRWT